MTVKRFALTPGEPAGIGPDLCLLLARDSQPHALIAVAPEQDVQMTYAAAAEPFDYKRGGLGLALPLARRVVERPGGRIWSPSVEGGATVRALVVSFPLPELNR